MNDMDLRNYRVEPDEGLYEKIEKRVVRRRWMRIGGEFVASCVVGIVVVLAITGREPEAAPQATVAQVAEMPAVQQVAPQVVQQEKADVEVVAFKEEVPDCSVRPAPVAEEVAVTKPEEPVRRTSTADAVAQPVVATQAPAKETVVLQQQTVVQEKEPVTEVETVETETPATDKADPPTPPVHIDNLVWAPNVIMPNGDVDDNRRFKLIFSSTVTDFRILIYNRGGRQVYVSEDPNFEWDGTFNGTVMPQGAYVWVAQFRDTDNHPHQEKGTVTIVR